MNFLTQAHYVQPSSLLEKPLRFRNVTTRFVKRLTFGCLNCVPKVEEYTVDSYKVNFYAFESKNLELKQEIIEEMVNVRIDDFERFMEDEIPDDISIATSWSETSLDQYFT